MACHVRDWRRPTHLHAPKLCLHSARGARLGPNAPFGAGGVPGIVRMAPPGQITFEPFLLKYYILGYVSWGPGVADESSNTAHY